MHSTTAPSPELLANLEHLGIADALDSFIAPERVRGWGFLEVERFLAEHGYKFIRENGNIYGRLRIERAGPVAPAPVLRVITRSDHAATYPSRRAA